MHWTSPREIESSLSRPIIKFYNTHDVKVTAAELRLLKARLVL